MASPSPSSAAITTGNGSGQDPQSTTMPGTPRAAPAGLALASLSLAMVLASLGTSSANVALPTMAQAFSAPFQSVQWIVLAYLLATTTLIVSAGRLGDMIGRRKVLLVGLALFAAASLVCSVAPTLWVLIAARAVQGLGAAILMTLALALVRQTVPENQTGQAMGLLGTTSALGTALGPSLGGLLIAAFGWRAIFMVNVPLALVALVLAYRFLPGDGRVAATAQTTFDTRGTLLLAVTLGGYALAVTSGGGAFGIVNAVMLVVALAGLGLFVVSQMTSASPLVPLRLLRGPVLRTGLAMSALVGTVMMATLVVGPFYLARALGLDAALVGIVMSVGPLVVALTGVPAGRLVDRLGASRMTGGGLIAMLGGAALLCLLPTGLGVPGYVASVVVLTLGYAVFQTANNTSIMQDVSPEQRGVISGLLNLSRNLGLMTGASVLGAVFVVASGPTDPASAHPAEIVTGMRTTFAIAALLLTTATGLAVWGSARSQADPPARLAT